MTRRRDDLTLDMFSWQPPEVVERYEDRRILATTWRDKVARAVSETLNSCGFSREEVAERMSAELGEDISKTTLDAYASQAKEAHSIPFARVIALGIATGDCRLLQLAAEPLGRAVVEARYLGAIDEAMATEQIEKLTRIRKSGRRRWSRGQ